MKKIIFSAALTLHSMQLLAGGNSVDNGGDQIASEFTKIMWDTLDWLAGEGAEHWPLDQASLDRLADVVRNTPVRSVKHELLDNFGFRVDARIVETLDGPIIELERDTWERIFLLDLRPERLVMHEYLRVWMRTDKTWGDSAYVFSGRIPLPWDKKGARFIVSISKKSEEPKDQSKIGRYLDFCMKDKPHDHAYTFFELIRKPAKQCNNIKPTYDQVKTGRLSEKDCLCYYTEIRSSDEASLRDVKSLEPLKYFENITSLTLSGGSIRQTWSSLDESYAFDLAEVSHASQVQNLRFDQYHLKNFEKLNDLVHLESLTVQNALLTSEDIIAWDLPGLKNLDLSRNMINGNLRQFAHVPLLRKLNLSRNLLTEFSALPFASLPDLTELSLTHNPKLAQLQDFDQLHQLKLLDLSHSGFAQISFAELPPNLMSLNMQDNPLTTLTGSGGSLKSLQALNLSRTELKGFPATGRGLTSLKLLDVSHNHLFDVDTIPRTLPIHSLNISNLALIDGLIGPVCQFPHLRNLDMSENEFTTLAIVKGCTTLVNLNFHGNHIDDLKELTKMNTLRFIDVSANEGLFWGSTGRWLPRFAPLRNHINLRQLKVDSRPDHSDFRADLSSPRWKDSLYELVKPHRNSSGEIIELKIY